MVEHSAWHMEGACMRNGYFMFPASRTTLAGSCVWCVCMSPLSTPVLSWRADPVERPLTVLLLLCDSNPELSCTLSSFSPLV